MDRQSLMEMMTRSISNVFETAFFQSVEILSSSNPLGTAFFSSTELTGSFLKFTGKLSGTVYIVAPDAWVKNLTADFLGIDVMSVTDNQKQDTIKEAVNMIAGHMFSFFDSEGEIQLGIPEMITLLSEDDLLKINGDVLRVMTDNEALAVVTELGASSG